MRTWNNASTAILAIAFCLPSCRCGSEPRRQTREQEPDKAEERSAPSPDVPRETPAPPATRAAAGGDPRFGSASLQLLAAGDQLRVHATIVIPAGQSIPEGTEQPGAIYFDLGPPIRVTLVAHGSTWDGSEVAVPPPVREANSAILKVPTRPQTTYRFDVTGAWERTRPDSPVTVESPR